MEFNLAELLQLPVQHGDGAAASLPVWGSPQSSRTDAVTSAACSGQ